MLNSIVWIEVWVEGSRRGEILLVLRAMNNGSFVIVNPQANNYEVEHFNTYEDARLWLVDDEYENVRERWYVDTFNE